MKAQIVSFHCIVKNRLGRVLNSTFNQDIITCLDGSDGEVLKGLAERLQNLKTGEKRSIFLTADQAYGFYNPDLVIEISKRKIFAGENLEVGQEVSACFNGGEARRYRVIRARGSQIVLDGNHPLAGLDLIFDIETTAARDATPQEIEASSPKIPTSGDSRVLH